MNANTLISWAFGSVLLIFITGLASHCDEGARAERVCKKAIEMQLSDAPQYCSKFINGGYTQ